MRPLMIEASRYNTTELLDEWKWLIPTTDTPLFLSALGDWVFGHADGSLWALSVLEGTYERIAANSAEYNKLNKSVDWLESTFSAGWLAIAAGNGLEPEKDQCIGWKLHPLLGGKFELANLQLFHMRVYQSLMGQLHRQLRARKAPKPPAEKKSWFKWK
jgi:hypothetical protein